MKHKSSNRHTVKSLLSIVLFLISLTSLYPRTYLVKQDGTGNFTTITAGINAAVNGDTLLVHPGRYVENLNYNGKNITITSLFGVTSDDRTTIRETIIDGNQNGTVIIFDSGETNNALLNGFTVTNGYAWEGGGIKIVNGASPTISNCIIRKNVATRSGGGIHIRYAPAIITNCFIEYNTAYSVAGVYCLNEDNRAFLSGSSIRYNHALDVIGGVRGVGMVFCSDIPNSIYHNYAQSINDLGFMNIDYSPVIIDTFTVIEPDPSTQFHVAWHGLDDDFEFIVLNAKIDPVSADLYVSAEGSDDNSGLTPDEPLKTIALAMSMINPDIPERRNIFVADGIYSKSLNDQFFPVQMRSNVNVIGGSKERTVLDMENNTWAFSASRNLSEFTKHISNFSIKNFSIFNGGYLKDRTSPSVSGMNIYSAHSFEVENIGLYNGESHRLGAFRSVQTANYTIKNIEIENCKGDPGILLGIDTWVTDESYGYLENIRINNFSNREGYEGPLFEFGRSFRAGRSYYVNKPSTLTIVNLEITDGIIDNVQPGYGLDDQPYGHFEFVGGANPGEVPARTELRLINSTIGNNTAVERRFGGGLSLHGNMEMEIYNSIIYGNRPFNFTVGNRHNFDMNISVYNSLVEGGRQGIHHYNNAIANIYWDNSNIDTDPLWVGDNNYGIYPYMLSDDSPARGAGTLDIPNFEFPEYDLAGNPRIVDGQIDMGAYQWRRRIIKRSETLSERNSMNDYNLRNFPNPAVTLVNHSTVGVEGHRNSTTGTNIAFELPEAGNVMIEIYNLKGQFVKRIFDAYIPKGEHNVFWDGRDERGRYVATGFYMYNLHINDQLVATGRATFIK